MIKSIKTLILASITLSAYSQSDSLNQEIEEIVISDKRLEIGYSEVSRTINIIDYKDIANMPVHSVAELLQYVSGVDVRRRGLNGVQADISIRGGTFDQSLLLINGVNMSDPQTGHHLMNIPVDIENIERIEILKGPAARVYGQNAFAGAINIVTKKSSLRKIQFSTSYSQNVTGRLALTASLPGEKVSHQISISKAFSEGYRYNTDYTIDNIFYQSHIDIAGNELLINAGYSDRAFGANGFYASPNFKDQYEEIGTSIVSAKYVVKKDQWKIIPTLFWRRNQDEYIFVRSNPSIYRNLHIGNAYGIELNASQINKLGILGIGVDGRLDQLRSNNLGKRNRTTLGFNMEQRFSLLEGKIDVTPGFAAYSYSDFGARVFPGLDIGVALSRGLKIFGNIGSTWRVPTYTDLFYEDPANLGNPDLEAETALTTEVGLKYLKNGLNIQVAGFSRVSNNLIDWTKETPDSKWFPDNLGKVTVNGLEINSEFDFNRENNRSLPRLTLNYTYLDGKNNIESPLSRYALDLITHHITGGISYQLSNKFYHSFFVKYADRLNLENYTLVDSKIGYRTKKVDFNIFANNLLDKVYTETNLVPMPGRWIGINLNFRG